jgi:DinB superfamily
MIANDILLDGFTRVYDVLQRILPDLTEDELTREPHPSIGWLTWRLTRVMDSNVAQLSGGEQLWIAGWAARFGMAPEPADYGKSHTHTREQVRAFRAPAEMLLAYHDAVYDVTKSFLKELTPEELARELDEPRFQPLPTVAVRLVSVLENAMTNEGQIIYLKSYHRLGGYFPREAKDPNTYR